MSAPKGFLSQHRTLYNLVKPTLPKAPSDTKYLYPLAPNLFYPPRGQKEVYLPNFVLTLLRPHPDAPPNFASFLTPLNLNKLDLKDYLYNAYGVHVLSVRSYVQQKRVREGKPRSKWPQRNRWYRPRATKKMTVELAKVGPRQSPFVWPDELNEEENLTPEEKDTYQKALKQQRAKQETQGPEGESKFRADMGVVATQARALRSGKQTWRPGWADFGRATGVGRVEDR